MRAKKIKPLVEKILEDNVEARGDDFILILEVLNYYVLGQMPLETVLKHHIELGLPSFASIIRVRRKLQEERKELNPADGVKEMRDKEEQSWRDFAREG